MTTQTRSMRDMTALVAAVRAAPTVEAGLTLALQGVSNQLSVAAGADQNGDKLALPVFAAALKASTGALVSAVTEDVEPTKGQIEAANQELAVAKQEVAQAQANAQTAKAPQQPGQPLSQAEIAIVKSRIAQAQSQGNPPSPSDVQLIDKAKAAGLTT